MTTQQPDIPAATQLGPCVLLDDKGVESWQALQHSAAWFELPGCSWMSFEGEKAAEAVNGLVTNDVLSLTIGCAQYAAALTPKGKIISDLLIVRETSSDLLVGCTRRAFPGWFSTVRKYVNPRLAKYRDEQDTLCTFAVFGKDAAHHVVAIRNGSTGSVEANQSLLAELHSWKDWQIGKWHAEPAEIRLLRLPMLGDIPGFLLICARSDANAVRARLETHHGPEGRREALEVARIQAGRPRWGVDMDDSTLAQEANLEELSAISFDKGCYTGQETVARVHFRGRVNRYLRGLVADSPIPPGAEVLSAIDLKIVGDVRSSAVSPTFGSIALGMLRRELATGDSVFVSLPGGKHLAATVCDLPFSADCRAPTKVAV